MAGSDRILLLVPGKKSIELTDGIREDRSNVVDGTTKWRSPTIPEPFFSLGQRGIARKKKGERYRGGLCVEGKRGLVVTQPKLSRT